MPEAGTAAPVAAPAAAPASVAPPSGQIPSARSKPLSPAMQAATDAAKPAAPAAPAEAAPAEAPKKPKYKFGEREYEESEVLERFKAADKAEEMRRDAYRKWEEASAARKQNAALAEAAKTPEGLEKFIRQFGHDPDRYALSRVEALAKIEEERIAAREIARKAGLSEEEQRQYMERTDELRTLRERQAQFELREQERAKAEEATKVTAQEQRAIQGAEQEMMSFLHSKELPQSPQMAREIVLIAHSLGDRTGEAVSLDEAYNIWRQDFPARINYLMKTDPAAAMKMVPDEFLKHIRKIDQERMAPAAPASAGKLPARQAQTRPAPREDRTNPNGYFSPGDVFSR